MSNRLVTLMTVGALALCGGCVQSTKQKAVDHYATALALEQGNFKDDAIVQLQEAVSLDSEMALAHSKLGELYQEKGQYQRAAVAFEAACRLDPWAFSDHLNLGKVYRKLLKFQQAIQILRRACQLNPQSSDAQYNLGVCYFETEDYDLAAAFCSRAAELEPENELFVASLGEIYGKLGDNYRAIKSYKQALEIDPQQYDVMIRLGMVYLHMERYSPAQFIFQKAIETAPTNPEPYLALGYCFLSQKQLDGALDQYSKALLCDSKSHAAYNGIGVAKMIRFLEAPDGSPQDAIAALECWYASLELQPDQPKIKRLIVKYRHLAQNPAAQTATEPVQNVPPAETPVEDPMMDFDTDSPRPAPPTEKPATMLPDAQTAPAAAPSIVPQSRQPSSIIPNS